MNQRQLLRSETRFELFLTGNGCVDIRVNLEIHQLVHVVLLGKTFVNAGFVLGDVPGSIVGYANAKDGMSGVGEQVDVISAHDILAERLKYHAHF